MRMDVSLATEEYLASITRLEKGTRLGYEQRLRVFADYCTLAGVALEHITRRTVDAFVLHLTSTHTSHKDTPLSSHTTAGYVRCIKTFMAWCLDDEQFSDYVKLTTLRRIKLPKLEKKIIATFTDAHIEALVKAAQNEYNHYLCDRDIAIIQVLLTTGIRAQELCGLKIANCHLKPNTLKNQEESYLKVYGKGRKEREIPLDETTRRTLARFIRQYRASAKPSDVVFVNRDMHTHMAVDGLEAMLDRLAAWSGIPDEEVRVSPHTFRHTFASRFMLTNGNIYHLQRLLGHVSVQTTERYIASISGMQIRLSLVKHS
jgi:integrase/recombinase XerD